MSGKLILKCKNCGNEFERFVSQQRKNKEGYETYCSLKCMKESPSRRILQAKATISKIPIPIIEMTQIEIGYMAGCIDGEGSFNITPGGNQAFNVSLTVSNTDQKMLDKLCNSSGVGVVYTTPCTQRKGNKLLWVWHVGSRVQLSTLLPIIIPALITKRKRAEYVLEFCERRIATIITDERDVELRKLVRFENNKGRKNTPLVPI